MPDEEQEPRSLSEKLDLQDLIGGLVGDLRKLRAGEISVREAHARAELARQILRGVHYVVVAQRFLEGRALPKPVNEASEVETQPKRRSRRQHQ